jgi:hypothetical protein
MAGFRQKDEGVMANDIQNLTFEKIESDLRQ